MMTEAIATTTPVLAAGWSLLYMLFGGGIGGAILIFFGMKAIGRLVRVSRFSASRRRGLSSITADPPGTTGSGQATWFPGAPPWS